MTRRYRPCTEPLSRTEALCPTEALGREAMKFAWQMTEEEHAVQRRAWAEAERRLDGPPDTQYRRQPEPLNDVDDARRYWANG